MTVTEAAEILGLSRQACHKMIAMGIFSTVHAIGGGLKPTLIIESREVFSLRNARKKSQNESS